MKRSVGGLLALAIVLLGLAARLLAARGPLLVDEAWHLRIAREPDVASVYRAGLELVHPPLYVLLLHFWQKVARTDWQLRALSALFGGAFLWAAHRWLDALFGAAAALSGLALFAFLPSLVLVCTELRGYAPLLFMAALSLDQLERGLARGSAGRLAASGLFGLLALLTHYGAAFVVGAAFLYAVARLRSGDHPRRLVVTWLSTQAVIALAALVLYATHLSKLRGGRSEREAGTEWLQESFFRPGRESAARFLGRQTLSVFEFVFSTRVAALVALALVLYALVRLASARKWPVVLLLVSPFAAIAAAGLAALYPYGGSRHDVFLALFACAAASLGLAALTRERMWVGAALAAVLCPAAFAVGL